MDSDYNFPPEVRAALAQSVELRNQVVPMTQAQRDALAGTDLWDGRIIFNFDTDALNRYVAADETWGSTGSGITTPTPNQYNVSTSTQTGFATDTYVAGSNIAIPTGKIQVGSMYRVKIELIKTAAGVAAPVISLRVGVLGTTADTQRALLTLAAQTAVVDSGIIDVIAVARIAGAASVLKMAGGLGHNLAATGLSVANYSTDNYTSAAFDITGTGLIIGLSINAGTAASWTTHLVAAELINLSA